MASERLDNIKVKLFLRFGSVTATLASGISNGSIAVCCTDRLRSQLTRDIFVSDVRSSQAMKRLADELGSNRSDRRDTGCSSCFLLSIVLGDLN